MQSWLRNSISGGVSYPTEVLIWRIGTAVVLGAVVALLYRWARRGETIKVSFVTTLVLLSTLIAMATQVIGDNVARAFSLVGALSVVRFRTVVRDTQDTAFVILAVVVGMAAGANQLAVVLVGLILLALAAPALWPRRSNGRWHSVEARLSLRIAAGGTAHAACEQTIGALSDRVEMRSVSTAKQGSAIDVAYHVRLKPGTTPPSLVAQLQHIEGVDSVALEREE